MNCDQPELFIMVWTSCLWFHNTRLALAGFSSRNYNPTFRLWYLLTVSCKSVWISLVSPQILRCCNVLFPYLPEPPASFSTDVDSTTHTNCLLRSFFARWSDLCIRTEVKKKAQVFTPNTSKYHLPLIVSWLTWSHCVSVMVPFRPSHLGTAKVHPKSQYISGPPRPLTHFFSKYRNREYSEEGDQRRPPLKHRGPTHLWEVQLWGDVTRLPATFNRNEGWLHMPLLPGKVCCSPRDISASPLAKHQNT